MTNQLGSVSLIKKIIVLTVVIFCTTYVYSQNVTTYNTYTDYIGDKGVSQGEYKKWKFSSFTGIILFLDDDGDKVKVFLKDIWGFEYKGYLFRVFREKLPAMVVEKGEMLYYESGIAHLEMLTKHKTTGEFSLGPYCFVSFGLNGEVISCPVQKHSSLPYKYFKKYRKTHPQYEGVLKCLDDCDFDYKIVRLCVINYNKNLEEY